LNSYEFNDKTVHQRPIGSVAGTTLPSQNRLKTANELVHGEYKRNSMSNKQSPKAAPLAQLFYNSN
jgi:hypothetical protein